MVKKITKLQEVGKDEYFSNPDHNIDIRCNWIACSQLATHRYDYTNLGDVSYYCRFHNWAIMLMNDFNVTKPMDMFLMVP